MAVSITSDLTDITLCNTTTDGGTFYRLNGTNSANPAADADAQVQGAGCIANKMGTTTGTTDTGGHFNHTTTFDLTSKHLFHWRQIVTAGNMLTKANRGVCLGLTNTSTTSNTAWSTTNYKLWFLDGSDTVPVAKGWDCYVLDPSSTADASAGTLTLTTVKNVGFICRQNSGVTTTVSNQFVDAVRAGTGLTATASSSGDTITFQNLYDTDKTNGNSWGIITQNSGIFYGAGKMIVGATGQTNTCAFTDSDQVLVWRKFPVASTFYEFSLLGAASFKTTMTLTRCVIRGQSAQTWNMTTSANGEYKFYSCNLANMLSATLSSTSLLSACSISASGTITIGGATISGCAFTGQTATQISCASPAEAANVTSTSFTSPGTGHAMVITGTAANFTLTGVTFTSYAASNGSTGNEAIYVNIATGSMTISIAGGGSTPSIRTAGCTVTVQNAVTVKVTVKDANTLSGIDSARVLLRANTGTTVTITRSGSTATVAHSSHGLLTGAKVVIKGADQGEYNGTKTITFIDANSYSYTVSGTPTTPATGTITSYKVILDGSTNVSGVIQDTGYNFISNLDVAGSARKASGSPYYKPSVISGTIVSTGFDATVFLVGDN